MTSGTDWPKSSDGSLCTSPRTYSPRAHWGTDWPTPRPACWPGSSNDGCTGPTTAETSTPCSPATTCSPTQRSTGPATPSPARSARTPTTTGTPGHPPMTGRQSSRHRPGSRSSTTRTPRESTARKSASSRFWQATAPLGTTTSTSPPTPTAATSSPGRSRNNGPPTWSRPSSRSSPRHQHEHHPLQRTADPRRQTAARRAGRGRRMDPSSCRRTVPVLSVHGLPVDSALPRQASVEGAGSLPEGGSCLFALVVQDFGVGEPGMVVDGVVEVGVAAAGLGVVTGALLSPDGAVPSAVGDASELLDVEVNEIARLGGLVADWFRSSYAQSSCQIEVRWQRHPVALEDPSDGGTWNAEVVADAMCPPSSGVAQGHDASFCALDGSRW